MERKTWRDGVLDHDEGNAMWKICDDADTGPRWGYKGVLNLVWKAYKCMRGRIMRRRVCMSHGGSKRPAEVPAWCSTADYGLKKSDTGNRLYVDAVEER